MALALLLARVAPATAQSAADPAAAIVSGPLGARADALLTRLGDSGFSGVVLVAKDGDIVLRKGYGLANRTAHTPMSPASVVQIGSNTKDFTIVALLQLLERGKLHLSDSITKYFPNVPADRRGITIEQLMRHRAGFAQHLGPDFEVLTREQEIARALASPRLFAPGTDRRYSNIGYSLLAAIIEEVSGASYDQYVHDHILAPLGLLETGLLLPHFDPARVAHGYRDGRDMGTFLERPLAPDGPYWNLRGNGGMLSTVNDMYRFYRALMSDGPLLKPATRDLVFHPERSEVLAGSDLTFFFFYSRNPDAGLEAILVSNSTDYPAPHAREALAAALGVAPPPGAQIGGPAVVVDTQAPRLSAAAPSAPTAATAAESNEAVSFPDTPVGRAARRFIVVNGQSDLALIRAFLDSGVVQRPDDHRTLDERVAAFRKLGDNLGALTPTRIIESAPGQISFEVRSAKQGRVTFTIDVESKAPWRITGIRAEAQ